MPTLTGTRVSVGSRSSTVDYYPSSSTGGGPAYKVGFVATPTGIGVGDIGLMSAKSAGDSGGTASNYKYRVDAIDGSTITLTYLLDSEDNGDASPLGLFSGSGDSGAGEQTFMTFERAFSTLTAFEGLVEATDDLYWGASDDVVALCYADSTFVGDSRVYFDNKQSLSSVSITAASGERHSGTHVENSHVVIKPTANAGHNNGIIDVNIDNFLIQFIDIDLDGLDSRNTNKAIVLRGTNDECVIRNNLIHDKGGNPGDTGPFAIHVVGAGASSDNMHITNNIIYNFVETSNDSAAAMLLNLWAGTVHVYNNTVYNIQSQGSTKVAVGIRVATPTGSVGNVKNNIVAGLVSAASNGEIAYDHGVRNAGNGTFNESHNLSDDTSATAYDAAGTGSLINQTLSDIAFVSTTGGSEDLHLDTDSVAIGAGVDVGTATGVNIDVDEQTMSGDRSMGADFVSSADTGSPAFLVFLD